MKTKMGSLGFYGIPGHLSADPHATTHDHNLCYMQEGEVLHYLHLERYSRRKYDNRLSNYWEELLAQWDIPHTSRFIGVDSFVGTQLKTAHFQQHFERGRLRAGTWPAQATWQGQALVSRGLSQELAHIASCLPFFGSFRENSLLIHFDGGAGQSNFSAWAYRKGQLTLLEASWDMVSYAKLFNANPLVFKLLQAERWEHCAIPGKLMGYAAYGRPDAALMQWLAQHAYFEDYWGREDAILAEASRFLGRKIDCFDQHLPFWQNVAASYQQHFEQGLLRKIAALQQGYDYLYYTGGCALNIVANRKLWEQDWFEEIFIPPCCNDSGLAIGAAAWDQWQLHGQIKVHSPYLQGSPQGACRANRATLQAIAACLAADGLVGLCCGAAEVGPRALGHRSILARPDKREVVQRLNQECKKREWYRPLAPVMLESSARVVTGAALPLAADYMLLDFPILPRYQSALAGVVHENGTARIQCLRTQEQHPLLYDLLQYCWEQYGWYGLVNTSFNTAGQPIVQEAAEARQAAKAMNLDGLFVNGVFHPF